MIDLSVPSGSSVTDWIQVIGTLVVAAGTVAVLFVALWILREETRRNREERAWAEAERSDRLAAQARLVRATPDLKPIVIGSEPRVLVGATVENNSNRRVEILNLSVHDATDAASALSLFELLNGQPARVIPPDTATTFLNRREDLNQSVSNLRWGATVIFQDAEGLIWRRTDTDPPERVLGGLAPASRPEG
jgi:hypothetical protein